MKDKSLLKSWYYKDEEHYYNSILNSIYKEFNLDLSNSKDLKNLLITLYRNTLINRNNFMENNLRFPTHSLSYYINYKVTTRDELKELLYSLYELLNGFDHFNQFYFLFYKNMDLSYEK